MSKGKLTRKQTANTKNARQVQTPVISEREQEILKKVCDTIREEKITNGEELQKRFNGDMETAVVIRKHYKVVGATLFFVKNAEKPVYVRN